MGIGSRPATCSSCGKRLNRKQWYYRNGGYYCKKRCWVTASAKAAEGAAKTAPQPSQQATASVPANEANKA